VEPRCRSHLRWWVSCPKWTVRVETEAGRIVFAAPIVRRFVGQGLEDLLAWGRRFGAVTVESLGPDSKNPGHPARGP
jgi:hypothetical protein